MQVIDENNIDNYGGFELYEGINSSNLKNTFYGVNSLKLLNNLSVINKFACMDYITGRNMIDGGYEPEAGVFVSYIDSSYFAINSLIRLAAKSWIASNISEWIKERQNLNVEDPENYGGFEWKENFNTTFMEATYYGTQSLIELNSLYIINKAVLLNWTKKMKNLDGGFSPTALISSSTIKDTYFAIKTLFNLNNLNSVDINSTTSFIKNLQDLNRSDNINYGGFLPFKGSINTSLEATYYAIEALNETHKLAEINSTLVLEYVYSKYINPPSAFRNSYSQNFNLADTFFALNILSILEKWGEQNNGGQNKSENQNSIWILLIVPIFGLILFFYQSKGRSRSPKLNKKIKRRIKKI